MFKVSISTNRQDGLLDKREDPALGLSETSSDGATGAGPHAVTQVTGARPAVYEYNANGQMTCRNGAQFPCMGNGGRFMTWTVGGQLDSAFDVSGYDSFFYGPQRQIVRQVRHEIDGSFMTDHVASHFQHEHSTIPSVDDRYRSSVYFEGRLVYMKVDEISSTGTPVDMQAYYVHVDYQGTIDRLESAGGSGPSDIGLGFDPFGKRRSAASWFNDSSDSLYSAFQWTERGYTGHEHVDSAKLIHMGGRVQDPILGRMLSPDPILPNVAEPQELNRYAYVMNNPMGYTDPSGFDAETIFGDWRKVRNQIQAARQIDDIGVKGRRLGGPVDPNAYVFAGSYGELMRQINQNFGKTYAYDHAFGEKTVTIYSDRRLSVRERRAIRQGARQVRNAKRKLATAASSVDAAGTLSRSEGRPVVNSTWEATELYFRGSGEPAILGPDVQDAIINSRDQQYRYDRIRTGRTSNIFSGDYGVNLEFDGAYFVGETSIIYDTVCARGSCTTTFTSQGDGFWDIRPGPGDRQGPVGEIPGGRPYPFAPFSWRRSFPDPRNLSP